MSYLENRQKMHILKQMLSLKGSDSIEPWPKVLGYSSANSFIHSLSIEVKQSLQRNKSLYFKNSLIYVYSEILEGTVKATSEDFKNLKRLTSDLLKGNYSKFINTPNNY